jgi:hypothetical protein
MSLNWIYSHRGLWNSIEDQNSLYSIEKSTEFGFSTEIDLRIHNSEIFIKHDPLNQNETSIQIEKIIPFKKSFALNLKSDGISHYLQNYTNEIIESNSFVFDGSIPEMFQYKQKNIPHALRLSEYESQIPWEVDYLWVDGFQSDWWLKDKNFNNYLDKYNLIFVSPEIHKRDYKKAWEWILNKRQSGYLNLSICTDKPIELREMSRK